ncbi:MAG TPA: cation-transporting P-type ATPase [Acidimicrobiales bacterium]|nr:cation-transporting P-type ATPase [Acidimicrobiales bacterium]
MRPGGPITATTTPIAGLTAVEARLRLQRDGPNRLPPPRRTPAPVRLVRQLTHFFALMLWVASGLAWLAGLPQLTVAIAVVIILNAVFAFAQESRAGRAAERLRALLPRQVTVRRDGHRVRIDAAEVVVGDVLLLESGDRIPADTAPAEVRALLVDVSMLTGESEPLSPAVGEPLFAGTFVLEGEAEVVVTATGTATRLAGIQQLMASAHEAVTPLTAELHRVVRTIAVMAVAVGGVFFLVAGAFGHPASDGFVFAIGVTVALVPEALLPTVTLSLAWGAEQMSRRQVLVRNLEAVETLGSTTFICTDKTGTLTRNQMTVVEAWTPSGRCTGAEPGYDPAGALQLSPGADRGALVALAEAGSLCSVGFAVEVEGEWRAHGDPMEAAIDVLARRLGIEVDHDDHGTAIAARFPFDPRRRRMSVVTAGDVLVKGAPDALLPLCRSGALAEEALEDFMARGFRVLAVARRAAPEGVPPDAVAAERDLTLLGLLALEDPPRTDVRGALDLCRQAGIKVAMVTGDHPTTAAAIATEVGLRQADQPVVVGDDLPEDEDALGALLDHDGIVVARVSPEQKLRIARALKGRGHVVAMTGDGVNDGPALREADIGVAMGASGTDVAREAADLVLLDDHFASIVEGVEHGRATFLNVRRFLTYHLTDNVAEVTPFIVWALSGGTIPLALGVMQILAIDIGTDTLSATALGAEPPNNDVLRRPPVSGHLLNRTVLIRAFGILGPTVAACSMLAFFTSFWAEGWRPGDTFPEQHLAAASGAAFMTVVIAQKANAFACRSATRWPGALGWTSNPLLLAGGALEVGIALAVLFPDVIARELEHAMPTAAGWTVAFASAPVLLTVDAAHKWRSRRR